MLSSENFKHVNGLPLAMQMKYKWHATSFNVLLCSYQKYNRILLFVLTIERGFRKCNALFYVWEYKTLSYLTVNEKYNKILLLFDFGTNPTRPRPLNKRLNWSRLIVCAWHKYICHLIVDLESARNVYVALQYALGINIYVTLQSIQDYFLPQVDTKIYKNHKATPLFKSLYDLLILSLRSIKNYF